SRFPEEMNVSELVRFSVSLEADLLEQFDRYCREGRFATPSEAIRQLLRGGPTRPAPGSDAREAAAAPALGFDHHPAQRPEKLLELQHRHAERVVSTMHVHLDHDNCLEVIILRGRPEALREIAAELRGLKGIQKGQLVVAATAATPR